MPLFISDLGHKWNFCKKRTLYFAMLSRWRRKICSGLQKKRHCLQLAKVRYWKITHRRFCRFFFMWKMLLVLVEKPITNMIDDKESGYNNRHCMASHLNILYRPDLKKVWKDAGRKQTYSIVFPSVKLRRNVTRSNNLEVVDHGWPEVNHIRK